MKLEDFRIGWRLLRLEPAYSLIAVLGLSIGFAACFLMLALARYSFSFDTLIPEARQVYVVQSKANWDGARWTENMPMSSAAALQGSGAALNATRVVRIDGAEMRVGDVVQAISLMGVDPDFGTVFGTSVLQGDLKAALTRPDALALTRTAATRLFGHADALGRPVLIAGQQFQVAAVVADPADNSTLRFAALAGLNSAAWKPADRAEIMDDWSDLSGRIYVRLGAGADPAALAQRLFDTVDKSPLRSRLKPEQIADLGSEKPLEVRLRPILESYFNGLGQQGNVSSKKGNPVIFIVLAIVAVLVLMLATINYVNLATIRTIGRQREIAMRKVLGAGGMRIVGQMVAESILVVLLAAGAGMLLACLLLPAFSNLLGLRLDSLLTVPELAAAGAIGLVLAALVGTLAGAYPSWIALKMRPIQALGGRGNNEGAHGLLLRRLLTVLQFAVGIGFASIAFTISWQMNFISSMDYGFDPDPLLSVTLPADMRQANSQSFRNAVARLPGVTGVATAEDYIGEAYIKRVSVKTADARTVEMRKTLVSPDYFQVFGVQALTGRLFDPRIDALDTANAIVADQNAVKAMGFASPAAALGQFVTIKDKAYQIVGVNRDVITQHVTMEQAATIYMVSPETHAMTVRVGADAEPVKLAIQGLWKQYFPNNVFEIRSVRYLLENSVKQQLTPFLDTVTVATCVAVALAAFGMYILSAYSVQRKTREIVLRKLYGAMPRDIARLLAREFLVLLGIATVLGLPLAIWGGQMFLSEFAKPAPIGPWAAVAALFGTVVVALLSSLRHTLAAMRIAPALALRG